MEAWLKERKKRGGGGGGNYICYYLFRSQLGFRQWSENLRKRPVSKNQDNILGIAWYLSLYIIWEHVICSDMGTSEPAFSVLLVQLHGTSYS